MKKTVLSIIIVSFNTKDILLDCLRSITGGKLPFDYEVIIIDNGSGDESVEGIKKFIDEESVGRKMFLIENGDNLGFSKAVNQGIALSRGERILLLNSDVLVRGQALGKMVDFSRSQDDKVIIGARLLDDDLNPQPSVFRLPTIANAIREYWLGQKGAFSKYLPEGDIPVRVEAVVGAVMLIPRGIINQIGNLGEQYFLYFEDLDYCRRARKAGFPVYYLPEAQFIHAHGASGKGIPGLTKKWLTESSRKYHGWLKYYLLTVIIWLGLKWQKVLGR